jgi:predicted metal-dependent hydrolase
LTRDSCLETGRPRLLMQGLEEFNRGEFIECHESLERLWTSEPRPIRQLYQGILQISVAFHHLREHRYQPVVTLLERGYGYLEPFGPACMGVEVSALLASSARCLAEVKRLGPERLNDFDWSLVPSVETKSHYKADTENE